MLAPIASFTITGHVNGFGDLTIAWDDEDGFDDPAGLTEILIGRGERIRATPTGPTYTAADTPPEVALATARAAFDEIISEEADGIPEFDPTMSADTIS